MKEDVRQDDWGVDAKAISGVLACALGYLEDACAGQTVNASTLILSDSDNVLLFTAMLLTPGADEAG